MSWIEHPTLPEVRSRWEALFEVGLFSGTDLLRFPFFFHSVVQTLPSKLPSRKAKPPRALAGVVTVTRQVHFNSAHRLFNPSRSRSWNVRHYGLCSNPNWHGHNYVLEVSVRGLPDPQTGYVIDLGELKGILHSAIVDKCDHRNLNQEVPFLRGIIPTTENLVIAFWNELAPRLKPVRLSCVRLFETPRNFAEYHGPLDA